jgi:hypothetical protein
VPSSSIELGSGTGEPDVVHVPALSTLELAGNGAVLLKYESPALPTSCSERIPLLGPETSKNQRDMFPRLSVTNSLPLRDQFGVAFVMVVEPTVNIYETGVTLRSATTRN